jgi:protein involved in polysaccharide export with SLBB domain
LNKTPVTSKPTESSKSTDDDLFELITPSYSMGFTGKSSMLTAAEMITDEELEVLAAPEGIAYKRDSKKSPGRKTGAGQVEWVFENGKYVPVNVGGGEVASDPATAGVDSNPAASARRGQASSGWDKIGAGGSQARVIKIPVDKLFGGDSQYNIIIRPGDVVRVPVNVIGEFYTIGNVNYQGVHSLTGRPITLVQAIAIARGLGELAWPTRVEVTRRIARNRQVTVMVNLKKIAAGLQPDFFIKPNDTINVGTDATAIFLYSLRNAFSSSYGFGFSYSRNFAQTNNGQFQDF